jgi:hypothetical protein
MILAATVCISLLARFKASANTYIKAYLDPMGGPLEAGRNHGILYLLVGRQCPIHRALFRFILGNQEIYEHAIYEEK